MSFLSSYIRRCAQKLTSMAVKLSTAVCHEVPTESTLRHTKGKDPKIDKSVILVKIPADDFHLPWERNFDVKI